MTVPVPVPCPPALSGAIAVAPRKRRRRAPASGASDDCFACSKRNLRCDRRRPYCSQCLEVGSECSGYKTQLTWGVGVASRGKLRGLSLPIAKSAPAIKCAPRARPRAASTISRQSSDAGSRGDEIDVKVEGEAPMPTSTYTTYDFINMVPNSPTSMQGSTSADWTLSISEERMRSPHPSAESISQQQLLRQSLQRLHTPMLRYDDELNFSSPTPSLSGYSDADYSPIGQSFPGDDVSYMASPMPMFSNYSPHDSPVAHYAMLADPRGPTSCPPEQYYSQSEMSSSISSHPTIFEMTEHRRLAPSPAACGMSDVSYEDEIVGHLSTSHNSDHFLIGHHMNNSWTAADDEFAARAAAEAGLRSLSAPEYLNVCLPLTQDVSPRLGFYLNYYEKIICPITVAIDSPSNPYRSHILSLATGNPSLQHAICALASCNLRMRRKQSLRQDHWRQIAETETQDCITGGFARGSFSSHMSRDLLPETPLDDASVREEYQHRTQAVALLNQQLIDPSKAKDDSVLATLFILCHYRMCQSGIAQFKTQFAGVKKLLGMRASGVETGNWGWMETIFTFFDAITATVNDREAQLRGGYLEMIANYSTPDFALENLAGCDGKLFKIIATLGRLNLLSQRRPVLDPLNQLRALTPATTPQPCSGLAGQALVDFYKFHDSKFDGNGFGRTIEDDELHILLSNSPAQSPTFGDDDPRRGQFWAEWKETRVALQTWEFDPARLISSLGNITPTPGQIRDFGYVSEAFRHAALLYTERLANPNLPSSHLSIQNLVAQVLFYITSLSGGETSDAMGKFLLWPLFVVGSECVSELHRSIIRTRCREIGARGGYLNNLAGLDVLEMIWKEGDGGASGRGPFRWTGLMDGVEGEYIMV